MKKKFVIQWQSTVNGRAGRGTKLFERDEAEQLAQELLHQYEVVCSVPDGVKPGDKLSVSSKRKGITTRAPARLPE